MKKAKKSEKKWKKRKKDLNFASLCFASKQKLLNRSEAKFQNRSKKKSQSRVPLKKSNQNCRRLHSCLKGPKREIFVAGIARKWPLPAYLYSLVCVFKSSTQRSPLIDSTGTVLWDICDLSDPLGSLPYNLLMLYLMVLPSHCGERLKLGSIVPSW